MESSTEHKKRPVSASKVWMILAGLLLAWYAWNPVKIRKFDSAQIFCLLTMALLMIRSLLIIIEEILKENVAKKTVAAEPERLICEEQMPGKAINTKNRMEKCIKLLIYSFACILYLIYCCKANQAAVTSSIKSSLVGAAVLAASSIVSEMIFG